MTRTSARAARLVAAALALLGLGGCARTAPGPAEPSEAPPSGAAPTVDFTASVRVGAGLTIAYRLVNHSGGDLIVLNRVPAVTAGGAQTEDANAVYITGAEGGRVEIAKRAFAMPQTDRMAWNHPGQIAGVIVHDGASVAEELTVALPLHRRHPYGDDIGYGPIALPSPITEVIFCLGVVVPASLPSAQLDPLTVTLPHLSATTAAQHLFCSAPASL